MKFGGTSVGSARAIRQVVQVVQSRLPRRPVVVVSAQAGVTDEPLALARAAADGEVENGGAAEVLTQLAAAGVAVRCAGLGPVGATVAFAVDSARLATTVQLLHDHFFRA